MPVDGAAYARYRDLLLPEADRLGVVLPEVPVEDDDHWRDKVDLLVDAQVPLVSFTFGIPDRSVVSALHAAGSVLAQTVTSAEEAVRAAAAGLDVLVVQGSGAGGHSATLTPERIPAAEPLPGLVAEVRSTVGLPLVATGGLASADDVAGTLRAGADAAMVGTVLLLAPESGTSAVHRAALGDPSRGDTVVTRAFTGRPARALPNAFIAAYDREAPRRLPGAAPPDQSPPPGVRRSRRPGARAPVGRHRLPRSRGPACRDGPAGARGRTLTRPRRTAVGFRRRSPSVPLSPGPPSSPKPKPCSGPPSRSPWSSHWGPCPGASP